MINFLSRLTFGVLVLLTVGLIFGLNPISISAEVTGINDSNSQQVYTNDELMKMSEEELEKLGLKEIVEEGMKGLKEEHSLSSFYHRAGDILVTNNTQCKSGSRCKGMLGHAGIVRNPGTNGYVVHIRGPGYLKRSWTSLFLYIHPIVFLGQKRCMSLFGSSLKNWLLLFQRKPVFNHGI